MTDLTIPDAAVEAAVRAQFEWSGDESRRHESIDGLLKIIEEA